MGCAGPDRQCAAGAAAGRAARFRPPPAALPRQRCGASPPQIRHYAPSLPFPCRHRGHAVAQPPDGPCWCWCWRRRRRHCRRGRHRGRRRLRPGAMLSGRAGCWLEVWAKQSQASPALGSGAALHPVQHAAMLPATAPIHPRSCHPLALPSPRPCRPTPALRRARLPARVRWAWTSAARAAPWPTPGTAPGSRQALSPGRRGRAGQAQRPGAVPPLQGRWQPPCAKPQTDWLVLHLAPLLPSLQSWLARCNKLKAAAAPAPAQKVPTAAQSPPPSPPAAPVSGARSPAPPAVPTAAPSTAGATGAAVTGATTAATAGAAAGGAAGAVSPGGSPSGLLGWPAACWLGADCCLPALMPLAACVFPGHPLAVPAPSLLTVPERG